MTRILLRFVFTWVFAFSIFLAFLFFVPIAIAQAAGLDRQILDTWISVKVATTLALFVTGAAVLAEMNQRIADRLHSATRSRRR